MSIIDVYTLVLQIRVIRILQLPAFLYQVASINYTWEHRPPIGSWAPKQAAEDDGELRLRLVMLWKRCRCCRVA